MSQQGTALTPDQRSRFLDHLRASANITASAASIGTTRQTAYRWRERDPEFRQGWDDALAEATDALEAEARRRAVAGYDEYITCRDGLVRDESGRPVMQKRYSDTLLIKLLQAHRPERFRDRASVELSVAGDLAALIEEGRKRVQGGTAIDHRLGKAADQQKT